MSARDQVQYVRLADGTDLGPFVHLDTHDRIVADVIAASRRPVSFPRLRKWARHLSRKASL